MAANNTVLSWRKSLHSSRTDDGSCAGDPVPKKFTVWPTTNFTGTFPSFSQPRELGHFSLKMNKDRTRSFVNDDSHLKHYYPPSLESDIKVNLDLGQGFDNFVKIDDNVKERLDNIMKWIIGNNKQRFLKPERDVCAHYDLGIDFIACRGHFTKFLCTPNENSEGWKMAVTLFNGTIYISEVETEQNRKPWVEMTDWEKQCMYGGYKFEQYVTSSDDKKALEQRPPVNNIEAYFSVVCSDLKPYKLLYSAEVDCLQQGSTRNLTENYLELKTSGKWYTHKNKEDFFRYKLLKWWAQSFLVGIPEVICGFREKDGFIRKIEHFKTMQMPDLAQKNLTIPGSWDGSVCFNFLLKLLAFIKSVAVIDEPSMVYLFERKPGDSVISYTEHKADEQQFIPEWYINAFKKDSSASSAEAKAI